MINRSQLGKTTSMSNVYNKYQLKRRDDKTKGRPKGGTQNVPSLKKAKTKKKPSLKQMAERLKARETKGGGKDLAGKNPGDRTNKRMSPPKGIMRALGKRKTRTGYKNGGGKFPDLSGDGKVTKKDILMGRGVIKKNKTKSKAKSRGRSYP
tara:strand:- start:64 stop:516 length:453 start_codon:yes stop_codon:yes gene_type:complete